METADFRLGKNAPRLGLYLHIPFCARKCFYCDFYSIEQPQLIDRYLAALIRQMEEAAPLCEVYTVDTVFVGGGTPSLLSDGQWEQLFSALSACFSLESDKETTVEVNPDSASPGQLALLRRLGVNRLSIGAQSFDDRLLRSIGRLHDAAQVTATVKAARAAGFDNVNLDLMYALPDQTPQQFYDSLRRAFALEAEHLSAYGLKVEANTPFGRMGDALILPDEDTWAEEYLTLCRLAEEAGLKQYEISNFARPGKASRHNLKYWMLEEYLGLGPAAHSFFRGKRFGFSRDLSAFLAYYETPREQRGSPAALLSECSTVTEQDLLLEDVMLTLRTARGIDLVRFRERHGKDFEELAGAKLQRVLRAGLMCRENGCIRMTPQGFLVSNAILAELIGKVESEWDDSERRG